MSGGLLVIGSGPAGLAAARAYRDNRGSGSVRILSADVDPPYNRPPLSKDFLRAEIEEDELALVDTDFFAANDVELSLGRSVRAVDPDARTVTTDDGQTLSYDKLVIATGASPTRLPVPGGTGDHVLQLRSLAHARRLRAAARTRSAVVIGSGFIGCEAAVSLRRRGVAVTLVTQETHPHQARLGDEASHRIARWLTDDAVALVLGAEITAIADGADGRVTVRLAGHEDITADFVLVATGVAPNADLVASHGVGAAGIGTARGRIVVDATLRTNYPDVFAAGDVTAAHNATAGRPIHVEHWSDADAMGEIAGTNAAGGHVEWDAVPGFWSEIGDRTLKYHAWGDGFDDVRFVSHPGGGFTAWYIRDTRVVGVLTHDADNDYERGEKLIAAHSSADEIES
jgi:3-phenylpropionate/trans-cinnamate dioxygenase ferredoxin reductase component